MPVNTAAKVKATLPENGMQIIWDVITREIVVIFRETVTPLPQKFESRRQGIEAGTTVGR